MRPDVVLSMGGYVAFPGGMMAALLGQAARGARARAPPRASPTACSRSWPTAWWSAWKARSRRARSRSGRRPHPAPRSASTGSARRCATRSRRLPPPEARYAGRAGPLRLLVVGGSLGAQTLNDLVLAALAAMPPAARPEVVHQAGEKQSSRRSRGATRDAGVKAEVRAPSSTTWPRATRGATCSSCRSGAITVAEIGVAGVAAILFPLPWFVADEQAANAAFLESRGAGIALAQLETTPASLAALLAGLTRDTTRRHGAQRPAALGKPDATRRCADLCEELAA